MEALNLRPVEGARQRRRRLGRGHGSGWGKTSGKGHKGQKARSGGTIRWGFEGGQMPLQRRIPKRGFNNIFALKVIAVQVGKLNVFEEGSVVDDKLLIESGIVKKKFDKIKIVSGGELNKKLNVKLGAFSESAKNVIESFGGIAEVI
ncbi:MAG: 50S ribosomal protein L15 [Oscillospiraceae bacterium]|jgi:large subunit ribosomal protein L15|nr:50S ribosomal protein L15 [Oscillospiraceae bacterium]